MSPSLDCQLLRKSLLWPNDLETPARQTLDAALAVIPEKLAADAELSVLLTDDAEQQGLNLRWRGLKAPTNVLSFPALAPGAPISGFLGDISLAFETVDAEAARDGIPLKHHFAHLLTHGFLHILGYDHLSEADAGRMEALEGRVLARLSIPDPYAAAQRAEA